MSQRHIWGESFFFYNQHSQRPWEPGREGVMEGRMALLHLYMVCTAPVFPLTVQRTAIRSRRDLWPSVSPEFWDLAASQMFYATRSLYQEWKWLSQGVERSENSSMSSSLQSQEKLCLLMFFRSFIHSLIPQQVSIENRCLCRTEIQQCTKALMKLVV